MLIKCLTVGVVDTNCYLVACKKTLDAIVIDPGFREDEGEETLRKITEQDLQVKYVVNTHGHADHISGNGILKQATGAEILIHERDAPTLPEPWGEMSEMFKLNKAPPCPVCGKETLSFDIMEEQGRAMLKCNGCGFSFEAVASPPADQFLHHDDIIKFGRLELTVIHTPGHSSGGISLYCERENTVFTGDTLYAGSIGRTDLLDSSFEDIMQSLRGKLMKLPEDTIVYPGHGEKTTIGKEKRENPFLRT